MASAPQIGLVSPANNSRIEIPTSVIELSISCRNLINKDILSKSDPQCFVYLKDAWKDSFHEIGRTEMIKDNLNPDFVKKIVINYNFEAIQTLKFEIWDIDNYDKEALGKVVVNLGDIVAYQGSQFKKPLNATKKNGGEISIIAEELSECRQLATFRLVGKKLKKIHFMSENDSYFTISRANEDGSFTIVYKSEVCRKSSDPIWKTVSLKVRSLCNGDYDRSLVLSVHERHSDKLIGSVSTNFNAISKGSATENYELINPEKQRKTGKRKIYGYLNFSSFLISQEYTFLDYIRNGTELHFAVAIDFTASNGQADDRQSLHYLDNFGHKPNSYETALRAVCEIIQQYDKSGMFPAFGFGAKVNGQVSHQFPLNGNPNHPYCSNMDELIGLYKHNVKTVTLYGPTNFAPVINSTASISKQYQDGKHYFVLLIITDGIISDMLHTMRAIIESASSCPMSIIIVGVGNADFSAMDELDADDHKLTVGGRVAERDIVQFVPLQRFIGKDGPSVQSKYELAQEVLYELPNQVTGFMKSKGFKPTLST